MARNRIAAALLGALCWCGAAAAVQVDGPPPRAPLLDGPTTYQDLQAVDRNDPAALLDSEAFLRLMLATHENGVERAEKFLASVPARNRGYLAATDAAVALHQARQGADPAEVEARFDAAMRNLADVAGREEVEEIALQQANIRIRGTGAFLFAELADRSGDSPAAREYRDKRQSLLDERQEMIRAYEEATGIRDIFIPIGSEDGKRPVTEDTDADGFAERSVNPKIVFFARPEYPEEARRARISGTVIVKVLVGTDGAVEKAALLQGVHPLLNDAAVDAAQQCRFEPGAQRGVPVRAWMALPFSFRLDEEEEKETDGQGGESDEG